MGCSRSRRAGRPAIAATSAIAGMLTFALSAYAVIGDLRVAAAAAVAAAALLALREQLHGWLEKITPEELRSGLALATMTFIALPIVPNEPIGPFGGVNPREVWIIAIVLAERAFLGYAAVKYIGARRGLLLAAAAGGLVSLTAVTITNARHAAAREGSPRLLAAGVAVASMIMFLRVAAIVAALQASLLVLVTPAHWPLRRLRPDLQSHGRCGQGQANKEHRTVEFRNPFDFWSVVGFACSWERSSCSAVRWGKPSAPPAPWRARSSSGWPMLTLSRCRWHA